MMDMLAIVPNTAAAQRAQVLYIDDFDEPPMQAVAAENPEIIAAGYTAEDIEAAREEGRLSALDDHLAVQSGLCNAAVTAIAECIAAARADASAIADRNAAEIAGAVMALLRLVMPATAARLAPDEINAVFAAILPPLAREPGLDLRVHPDVLPFVGKHLAMLKDVTITADPALAPPDVIVQWRDGAAVRDWATLWRDVSAALSPFSLPGELTALLSSPIGDIDGE